MIELGIIQNLKVIRIKEFGIYLGEDGSESGVLLPKKEVPADIQVGDEIPVFVYKDSEDRIIATTAVPKLQMGQLAVLDVVDCSSIGAFLDWGLPKDLFLPFKEQNVPVRQKDKCLVTLYKDKSGRLCATTRVYEYLSAESPYKEEDRVNGIIYQVNSEIGVFVAVDNRYYGLIPKRELYREYKVGEELSARVIRVREDGKLDLSVREKVHLQMDTDVQAILKALDEFEGSLPFGEKASAEVIKRELKMSKNAFKRGLGRLLKEGKIEIGEKSVKRL